MAWPIDPAMKNHQPLTAPAASPKAARAKAATPPASGERLARRANVSARGSPRTAMNVHDRMATGPASDAVTPGRTRTPAPRIAPKVKRHSLSELDGRPHSEATGPT